MDAYMMKVIFLHDFAHIFLLPVLIHSQDECGKLCFSICRVACLFHPAFNIHHHVRQKKSCECG